MMAFARKDSLKVRVLPSAAETYWAAAKVVVRNDAVDEVFESADITDIHGLKTTASFLRFQNYNLWCLS